MENFFYKVRLNDGRVIGPLDLERVKLFIINDKITGLETARYYPTGDWKDINSFSEIAELLLLKLEGKLKEEEKSRKIEASIKFEEAIQAPAHVEEPQEKTKQTELPPSVVEESAQDEEKTIIATPDNEKTMIVSSEDRDVPIHLPDKNQNKYDLVNMDNAESVSLTDEMVENKADPRVATEKTMALDLGSRKSKSEESGSKKKKFLVALGIVISVAIVLFSTQDKNSINSEPPFQVEMPVLPDVADHEKSEKYFNEALKFYIEDTVSGYKKASKLFLKSISYDGNNVRAMCLLASSYMNLIDVVTRDENYFNIVTRLIEFGRSKGVDLAETVIADVELYHILSNPDAALNRIVDFSKSHQQFGVEMFYYLSLSFFQKDQNTEALRYLNNIDPGSIFSAKIHYLYGLIYEKERQTDLAKKAFLDAVKKSPAHMKSRLKLAQIFYSNDNLAEASKQVDHIIANPSESSRPDLAKALYFRAKIKMTAKEDEAALDDLKSALKILPEDADILLDYYTLESRLGSKVGEAQDKAKMFYFLAQGEKELKEGKMQEALNNFMDAREAKRNETLPLLKIADTFLKMGDLQSAKSNYEKAVALVPKKAELYPNYIRSMVGAYEFEDATKVLETFKELNPPVSLVDHLQGDLFSGQERFSESVIYYKRALSSVSADSSVYVAYANALFHLNSFKDAAFFYGLAQRFDPLNTDSIIGIGKALSEIDSLEKAVQYVQEALQSSSNKAALLVGISEIYYRKGDYSNALKFANNALATDPHFVRGYKAKGLALAGSEKPKEALDAFQSLINLSPLDPTGYVEKYHLYMKKLDLKSAKSMMEKLIDLYPRYPGAYYMLGEVFKEGQNYDSALKAALEEIKSNQSYVQAYYLAGFAANKLNNFSKALEILNKGLKLSPDSVPILVQAGIANHFLKSYVAAQALYERAARLDQGNPEVQKRLGSLFLELGNKEKSNQHFKNYIDLYPNAPDREEVERVMGN